MHYTIAHAEGVFRAELFGRQSVDETREFARVLTVEALRSGCRSMLVCVRNSRPIFRVDQHRIGRQFRQLASHPEYRVALLGDSEELRASHEYIELLARQHGANIRAFRDEPAALDWLKAASP